ncbi:cobalt-precorrin 5A hydrolase [Pectinatus sottacetonis]|uniref:cobalt-precorrin 5A hydrolase n=1 Tax=Pectinatus sottacetonis TaxID=1002795 RepID=UPI0018C55918|nr:cobalt-precorrin 5A hydrolase [Pectinatus sottacetonis]
MKCAAIVITQNGLKLAEKIQTADLADITLSLYSKRNITSIDTGASIKYFTIMRDLVKKIFFQYDALIFFCAAGITVRMIAPYIKNKAEDPAVIVIDEQGHFAVSLLSGHLGGANDLTAELAACLGSIPVITTATDVNALLAPDSVARRLGLSAKPLQNIKILNMTLLKKKKIDYYIDVDFPAAEKYQLLLQEMGIKSLLIDMDELKNIKSPFVLVTRKHIEKEGILILCRHKLIAGIGCRRGTSSTHIETCLRQACERINYGIEDVTLIASAEVKADEPGILQMAEKYGIHARFFPNTIMKKMILQHGLIESEFVKKQIGIGNVCEAAALATGKCKLVLNKTKFEKVTVALAWEK